MTEGNWFKLKHIDGFLIKQPITGPCTEIGVSAACDLNKIRKAVFKFNHKTVLTAKGKEIYRRRKETVERSFADAKELHGHRYAGYRGLAKVRGQALLAAACQNMKKMAWLLEAVLRRLCLSFLSLRAKMMAFKSAKSLIGRMFFQFGKNLSPLTL